MLMRRGYWVGGLLPGDRVRSCRTVARVQNEQHPELEGMAWAVRLVFATRWVAVTIFADNTAAGFHTMAHPVSWVGGR